MSSVSNPGISIAKSHREKRLVLHFDINNTIVMKDSAKSLGSVEMNVARIVAKSAWGKVVPPPDGADEKEKPKWEVVHNELAWTKPEPIKDPESGEVIDIITYHDFLKEEYPVNAAVEQAKADENQAKVNELLLSFATEDGVGSKFQPKYQNMLKCLDLPEGAKADLNYPQDLAEKIRKGEPLWEDVLSESKGEDQEDEGDFDDNQNQKEGGVQKLSDEEKMKMTMFGEGKYHIIPSFFRTLIFLKKQRRKYQICFRTFGKDLDHVVWEFNQFCNGEHCCFSGRNGTPLIKFDGTSGTQDFRIRENAQKACFFRFGCELKDTRLVQGTYERPNADRVEELNNMIGVERYEDCTLRQQTGDQYHSIKDTLNQYGSMAFKEDYQNWKENEFNREVAKPLLVDPYDYNTHHIFFDDNADEDEQCIVDVRDINTKEIISYKRMMGRYVIKVEPFRAILEPDYFIKMIESAEVNRQQEIENVENGIDEDSDEQPKEVLNEWDLLQSLPDDEYLQRTVLPVLYDGMQQVNQQRPVAPVEYLALYLLKNQHVIKMPEKPKKE